VQVDHVTVHWWAQRFTPIWLRRRSASGTRLGPECHDAGARTVIAGHAFVQNIRRGHYELATDAPPTLRVATAFDELAQAV
jgi:hypothetical protein